MISRATPHPDLPAPAALVRNWRLDASERAVESLLPEVGCGGLTVDSIVRSLGAAKGSVYLRWPDVERLIGTVLDRWTECLTHEPSDSSEPVGTVVCRALLAPVETADGVRPAIPCCLRASPCPQGWNQRWDQLAAHYGLGGGEIAQIIGEAIQAIASSSVVRDLLAQGRFEDAAAVVALAINGTDDESDA